MHLLITGGCGYIGSHVCVELIQEGFEVIVFYIYFFTSVPRKNEIYF